MLFACDSKEDTQQKKTQTPNGPSVGETQETEKPKKYAPDREAVLLGQNNQQESHQDNPEQEKIREVTQYRSLSDMEKFVVYQTVPILPVDWEIGTLQNYDTESTQEKAILTIIVSFVEQLAKGEYNRNVVYSGRETELYRQLFFYFDNNMAFGSFRVGRISLPQALVARCNIRFLGDPGHAFGEIVCRKSGEMWGIYDVICDFSELNDVYVPEDEYNPFQYEWLEFE